MFPKKICIFVILGLLLMNVSVVSAGDTLRRADDFVGNIIHFIVEHIPLGDGNSSDTGEVNGDECKVSAEEACVDTKSGAAPAVIPEDAPDEIKKVRPYGEDDESASETENNEDRASDELTYVDIESGVTPPVPPEDTIDDIKEIHPSIVCVEQKKDNVKLYLEFVNYYESASPVYGESFTYNTGKDFNFKFFCGGRQAGNLPVSYLEFHNGRCTLSVPGIDDFDRIEVWEGDTMVSSKEVSREEKIPAEAELEITSLYHYFDDDSEMITTTVQKMGGDCSSSYTVYAVVSQENATSGYKTPDYETDTFELRFGEDNFATAPAFEIEPGGHNRVTVTLYYKDSDEKIDFETLSV